MSAKRVRILFVLVMAMSPTVALAQAAGPDGACPGTSCRAGTTVGAEYEQQFGSPSTDTFQPPRAGDQSREYRSPALASILSLGVGFFGIHGVGSYYAGNSNHGTRHLLLGFGTGAVFIAGLVTCDGAWGGGGDCGGASAAAATLGILGYLANWGWSTIAAGRDASAFNIVPSNGAAFLPLTWEVGRGVDGGVQLDIPVVSFPLGGAR